MRPLLGAAALLLAFAGCSADSDDADTGPGESAPAPTASATASATPTEPPYLPVPDGVELTAQGSRLRVGDAATVAWEPRKKVVGALRIRVTRVERASLEALSAFRLDKTQRRAAPFYVRATVENVGRTNLAGVGVPLYLVNGRDTLIQATPFAAVFKPCTGEMLPRPFGTGERRQVCLVYLVPDAGRMKAVSFRPTKAYDPITWTGPVLKPRPAKQQEGRKGD